MGIRITGVSTPIGGVSWEYTEAELSTVPASKKIHVFISSKCGTPKYDTVRAELKSAIEKTQLAEVYLFETNGASTLPAGKEYVLALEDCDICIFLIDNADGVPTGVQIEADTVKKNGIKSLYYFCDETSKEKTALEISVKGSDFAKSKTVHKFEDLKADGARELINDIVNIYHYYCIGKLVPPIEDNDHDYCSIAIDRLEYSSFLTMPKIILNSIDKCSSYILSYTAHDTDNEIRNTGDIDDWGYQFLSVLFEGVPIKKFNVGMFVDNLKAHQSDKYNKLVQVRWQAIQDYFSNSLLKCIEHLKSALDFAKSENLPTWVIQDILIDLRNQNIELNNLNNSFSESDAQKELNAATGELYYPVLDRIYKSLHEKYVEDLYKFRIQSPHTISIGSNLYLYGKMLASAYIVSIYNGSLTHILRFYDEVKDFFFYLSSKYGDRVFQRDMLKMAIHSGQESDCSRIVATYPEVLNAMSATEAKAIIGFCDTIPIDYRRLKSQLLALKTVGYYLDDSTYKLYEDILFKKIQNWLETEHSVVSLGPSILSCLGENALRLSQDSLAEVCCLFIGNHLRRYYTELFRFICNHIDLCKMSEHSAIMLVNHIVGLFENESDLQQIKTTPQFLCVLRQQSKSLTDKLDQAIQLHLPNFYNADYKINTTDTPEQDYPTFISTRLSRIQHSNEVQGENGMYFAHGTRDIHIIRNMLAQNSAGYSDNLLDSIVTTVINTIIESRESISEKLDAVSLLTCVAVKYPAAFERNKAAFEKLYHSRNAIELPEVFFSNIEAVSLKICLQFLFTAMGYDTYADILELMPLLEDNTATTISVIQIIDEYLELDDGMLLPSKIESIILQNVLQWTRSNTLEIRWYAVKILISMLRNPENKAIINHQLLKIMDSESVYIKNVVMRKALTANGISESTRQYIISKCENDANYVVREVCKDVQSARVAQ